MAKDFVLPVSREEWESAGSKFIMMTPQEKALKGAYRRIKVSNVDWDNPGTSLKYEFEIVEAGPDKGKMDKISAGVSKAAAWKVKEINGSLGIPTEFNAQGQPGFNRSDAFGKEGVAFYALIKGHKGGDPNAEVVEYPKVETIYPSNFSVPNNKENPLL